MTWHDSSGPCTRGLAMCTTWLLGGSAARITLIDKSSANNAVNWSKTYEDTLLAYYGADNNYSAFIIHLLQNIRPLMIVTIYIYQGFITHLRPTTH